MSELTDTAALMQRLDGILVRFDPRVEAYHPGPATSVSVSAWRALGFLDCSLDATISCIKDPLEDADDACFFLVKLACMGRWCDIESLIMDRW